MSEMNELEDRMKNSQIKGLLFQFVTDMEKHVKEHPIEGHMYEITRMINDWVNGVFKEECVLAVKRENDE